MQHLVSFLKYNYRNNWGLWFHMFIGMIWAKTGIFLEFSNPEIMAITIWSTLAWEAIEWVYEDHANKKNVIANYGSLSNYWYDTIADILGAIICAVIVIL